jgi:hypothetical protein
MSLPARLLACQSCLVWTFAGAISSPVFLFDRWQTCRNKALQGIIRLSASNVRREYCSASMCRGGYDRPPGTVDDVFGSGELIQSSNFPGSIPIGGLELALILALTRRGLAQPNVAFSSYEANGGAGHRGGNPYHHCLLCAVVSTCPALPCSFHLAICLGGSERFRQRTPVKSEG